MIMHARAVLSRTLAVGWMPDGVFGRMMAITLAAVVVPHVVALAIAPEDHRASLLGTLFLLLPPVACGVYFSARSVTRPLAKLTDEADLLGRRVEPGAVEPSGPKELRVLSMAFDLAQARIEQYVTYRARALAAMSHDLKTPLTRMRLRVETLSDDADSAEINGARERLARDIDDLTSTQLATLHANYQGRSDANDSDFAAVAPMIVAAAAGDPVEAEAKRVRQIEAACRGDVLFEE